MKYLRQRTKNALTQMGKTAKNDVGGEEGGRGPEGMKGAGSFEACPGYSTTAAVKETVQEAYRRPVSLF